VKPSDPAKRESDGGTVGKHCNENAPPYAVARAEAKPERVRKMRWRSQSARLRADVAETENRPLLNFLVSPNECVGHWCVRTAVVDSGRGEAASVNFNFGRRSRGKFSL